MIVIVLALAAVCSACGADDTFEVAANVGAVEIVDPRSPAPTTTTTTTISVEEQWESVGEFVAAVDLYVTAITPTTTAAPHVPVVTAPRAPAVSPDFAREVVEAYFPADQVDRALRIMNCESTFSPSETGGVGERGLLQIHPGWSTSWGGTVYGFDAPSVILGLGYTWDQMYEVWPNVHVASVIWSHEGWSPWTCKGKG